MVALLAALLLAESVALAQSAVVLSIDPSKKYQTMVGFGGSIAWYEGWVTAHPYREELYDTVFGDLGIEILRLQNWYGKADNALQDTKQIVDAAYSRIGSALKIMISSWAPPADIKSNKQAGGGGTLAKEDGKYVYDLFADYWYDSLQAYAKYGIEPDYISIQNEPDLEVDYNSNALAPQETDEIAGYPQALDAVYNRLREMPYPPKIIGPEVVGIGYDVIQRYLSNMNLDQIDGIAYHLYHGGDSKDPDSYKFNLLRIAGSYPDIPIFQTEFYDRSDGFETAWIIHNCIVYGNVVGYLYWDLVWPESGLVVIENPWQRSSWKTEQGFYPSERYYGFKHFSKYVSAGYQRIAATTSKHNLLKVSAFISPDKSEITAVVINTSHKAETLMVDVDGYSITDSRIYLTEFGQEGGDVFSDHGSLEDHNGLLTLPTRSVATIVLSVE